MSVNRADTLQRRGLYPVPAGVTQVLGLECAGHVTQVGRLVNSVSRGQAVMALLPGGGYAEHVSVHCGHVMRVPRGLSMDQAAAIPEVTEYHCECHLLRILRMSSSGVAHCLPVASQCRQPQSWSQGAGSRWWKWCRHRRSPAGQTGRGSVICHCGSEI